MKTVKLTDKQRVRIPGDSWIYDLTFHIEKYDPDYYGRIDPTYSVERFNEINRTKFGIVAFVTNPGTCLVADYPGKEEAMRREKEEYEASPIIEEGDVVEVDGIEHTFIAHVNGTKYSDCVSFRIQ